MYEVIFRRGMTTDWSERNPVLRVDEIGREVNGGRFKVGDGFTRWNDLPYSTTLPRSIRVRNSKTQS